MSSPFAGTLYGIGVGPGDPELLTVKAVRTIESVDVIFAASSTKNHHSQAVNIAAPYIPETTAVELLRFPMCRDRDELQTAWQTNARQIITVLQSGKNAAFLTLGDPLTYSTFGYILKYVKQIAPDIPVVSIPGITSYQAAAARLNQPLVEGEEALLVLSGVRGGDRFRHMEIKPENVVFLKAYRNVGDITDALDEDGRLEGSTGIANCGLSDEKVYTDLRELCDEKPGYWTLVISKRNGV